MTIFADRMIRSLARSRVVRYKYDPGSLTIWPH